jgi:hypothetical protein
MDLSLCLLPVKYMKEAQFFFNKMMGKNSDSTTGFNSVSYFCHLQKRNLSYNSHPLKLVSVSSQCTDNHNAVHSSIYNDVIL